MKNLLRISFEHLVSVVFNSFPILAAGFLLLSSTGCALGPASPTITPTFLRPTATSTPRSTATLTPSPTVPGPLTFVFYGDSLLKVGEVGRQAEFGFSFVDDLPAGLDPDDTLIVANYGGRKALWASEHLEEAVLGHDPDVVTLWWTMNDLGGCPGIFDRSTNQLLEGSLTALLREYTGSMQSQIDALLARDIPVFVVTAMPVLGGVLPWSHLDENGALIWEQDSWCRYNVGLERLAQAQRDLVTDYASRGQPVFLVDAWQIYMDHPDSEKMYMDSVHPGSQGAALIAKGWLEAFRASGIR